MTWFVLCFSVAILFTIMGFATLDRLFDEGNEVFHLSED